MEALLDMCSVKGMHVKLGDKASTQTNKQNSCTVKPVLSGHSKIDKKKILMTNDSLIKVKSIAECSNGEHSAILLTCIKR